MKNKQILIATIACIGIGIILRVYHLFSIGFSSPWNYGGLFLEFSRQIFNNHYLLPRTIPYYTQGGLPFAYPPIPFYFESLLVFTIGLPEFFVVNLLPPLISILSLLAFSFLVRGTLNNPGVRLFSIFLFSFLPLCFGEQIEAGGLAESFGTLFTILLLYALWKYYQDPLSLKTTFLASLIWALTVMASPGSAYLSVFLFITFSAMSILKTEKKLLSKVVLNTFMIALGAIIFSSPYWASVAKNHGIEIFLDNLIIQNGGWDFVKLNLRIISNMTLARQEPVLFNALLVMALCILIYYKEYSLVFLTIITGIIPREYWVMGIVGVFIVGYAFDLMLGDMSLRNNTGISSRNFSVDLLVFVIAGLIISRTLYFFRERDLYSYEVNLDREQIAFLQNIKNINTSNADLIIVDDASFLEWAPYLSQTTVLNVYYGTEFAPTKQWLENVTLSLDECLSVECVNEIIMTRFDGNILVIIDLKNKPAFDRNWNSSSGNYDSVSVYEDRFLYYFFKQQNAHVLECKTKPLQSRTHMVSRDGRNQRRGQPQRDVQPALCLPRDHRTGDLPDRAQ